MTDLELEKLADEEMLSMHKDDASSDELLDSLTDLPEIDLVDTNSNDDTDPETTEEAGIPEDLLDDLQLDSNEIDEKESLEDELPELEESNVNQLEDEQDLNTDIDEILSAEEPVEEPAEEIAAQEDSVEDSVEDSAEEADESSADNLDNLEELDDIADLESMSDEIAAEADSLAQDLEEETALEEEMQTATDAETDADAEAESETNAENAEEFINPNPAIDNMQDALDLKEDTDEIASSLKDTAKDVTKLAAATALQAQEEADLVQKNIQNTFIATERAFETIKKAGYIIDSSNLDELSDEELNAQIETITRRNSELKKANEDIKRRLAEIKT